MIERENGYVFLYPFLSDNSSKKILDILCSCVWVKESGAFYEIEVSNADYSKKQVRRILDNELRDDLKRELFSEFGFYGAGDYNLNLQKYSEGSNIGVHTDEKTHELRLIVNFNEKWSVEDGGIWILSKSSDLKTNQSLVPPLNNSAIGFLCAQDSYHCMSVKNSNITYSVILCFQSPIH